MALPVEKESGKVVLLHTNAVHDRFDDGTTDILNACEIIKGMFIYLVFKTFLWFCRCSFSFSFWKKTRNTEKATGVIKIEFLLYLTSFVRSKFSLVLFFVGDAKNVTFTCSFNKPNATKETSGKIFNNIWASMCVAVLSDDAIVLSTSSLLLRKLAEIVTPARRNFMELFWSETLYYLEVKWFWDVHALVNDRR